MATMINLLILACIIVGGCFARTIPRRDDKANIFNASPRYFEDQFNATIECIRRYLTQGDADNGLPPMDPLRFLEMKRLKIDNKFLWTDLKLFDIVIEGLMSFETQALNLSNLIKLDVDYHFKKIHLRTSYDGQINLLSMLTFDGQGIIDIVLNDVHVKTSTQYNMTPPLIADYSALLSLKKAKFTITGMMSEEWSRYFSIIVSKVGTVLINSFQKQISEIISPYIMEYYNSRIGHLAFLDFLAIISESTCPV